MKVNSKTRFWWRLNIDLPPQLEDSFIWKCEDLSIKTFSFEIHVDRKDKLTFWLWLPSLEWKEADRNNLIVVFTKLAETFRLKVSPPIWEKVNDEDWSSSWKRFWKPDPVGTSLLVLPAWLDLPEIFSKKIVLRLDPGCAFGTGSHPTTRLCLQALEKANLSNLLVADIGCGSGILSLAALSLGAKGVIAVDIDSLAISATDENAALNNFSKTRLRTSIGSIEQIHNQLQDSKVDLMVCNTLQPVIESLAPRFSEISGPNSQLFLSGLLVGQIQAITDLLAENGWQFIASSQQENWALIHLCKA